MKLLLKLYSVIYIAFCLYWFITGCSFCQMKGDFEFNFLGYLLLLQVACAIIAMIKHHNMWVLISLFLVFIISIATAFVLGILLNLNDRKALLLFAIVNYLCITGTYYFYSNRTNKALTLK